MFPIDRVGIGWRGELAAGIFSNLDKIDILEVIADDYFRASLTELDALKSLAADKPLTLHGVAMGLASSIPVEKYHLDRMARLVNTIEPESWSEHLAFVRAGDVEIGHLAAPPRTDQNIEGAIKNIKLASTLIASQPSLENIATLIKPPASTVDEASWISTILQESQCTLLLDLHNLYANALNFNDSPEDFLLRLPLDRVSTIHISGGKWIDEPDIGLPCKTRLLDDHLHDVPNEVYSLLMLIAKKATQPLTVILERDGHYPDFSFLLRQLDLAREALKKGRECLPKI